MDFEVVRNDQISLEDIQYFDNILLTPGPGLPSTAGIMPELIKYYGPTKNILGVCLGLQAIGEAYGATLNNLEKVCHGQATPIHILEADVLFKNCPKQFTVGRYHSWVVNKMGLPASLQITAEDNDGNIMALKHKNHNVRGVQFHPESILSEYGERIISNWLND